MTQWPWPSAKATLLSIGSIARHEFRMTVRERAGWGGIAAACALAFADSALKPHWPVVSGVRASLFGASLLLPPIALIFLAGAARRDEAVSAGDVINSRPYPAHLLLFARFVGNYAVVLFAYALMVVCGLAAPLALAGRWPSLLIPIHSFVRGTVPLLYVTALVFCAVSLARNVLAAGVVAAYWLFVFLWGDFLARIFNFTLTQNWPTYAAVGLGFVCLTIAIRHWSERESGPSARRLLFAAAGMLLAVGLADAWHRVATSHDPPLRSDPIALNMAGQHIDSSPRAPGFWLPDQHGRDFRLSSTEGRVLVLLLWSPHEPESVPALETLNQAAAQLPEDHAVCVAVGLSNDYALSPHIAAEGRYRFPMVTDTGTHFSGKVEQSSPIAEAYTLTRVPTIFVTDRRRRVVSSLLDDSATDPEQVIAAATTALQVRVPPS